MKQHTVNTEPLETLAADALAELADLAATVPDLLNPQHQRHGPRRAEPLQGPVVRRRQLQLQLMRHGLAFVRAVAADSPDLPAILAELQATQRQYGALSRLGRGWLDCRHVWRTQLHVSTNPETGAVDAQRVKVAFGPYVYYRWNEGGKQRSLYLGSHDEPAAWKPKLATLGLELADLGLAELRALVTLPAPPAASTDEMTVNEEEDDTVPS